MVIGGQAVNLHGVPMHTFDYDVWIAPEARREVLTFLAEDPELELSAGPDDPKPMVKVFAGPERMNLFFVRAMTNRDRVTLDFLDVLSRAEILSDRELAIERLSIPAIDDLIALKRMAPTARAKDEDAIRYLLAKKVMSPKG